MPSGGGYEAAVNWKLMIALGLLCLFLLGVLGCANPNLATYPAALNGVWYPSPYYVAPTYWEGQGFWLGPPRVTCSNLGQGITTCREI